MGEVGRKGRGGIKGVGRGRGGEGGKQVRCRMKGKENAVREDGGGSGLSWGGKVRRGKEGNRIWEGGCEERREEEKREGGAKE